MSHSRLIGSVTCDAEPTAGLPLPVESERPRLERSEPPDVADLLRALAGAPVSPAVARCSDFVRALREDRGRLLDTCRDAPVSDSIET